MAEIRRRRFLSSAALALPASMLVNAAQADSADYSVDQLKVSSLKDR